MRKGNEYTVLDLLNDLIHASCMLIVMMGAVIGCVSLWGVYNPQIKTTLLTIQNELFSMFY